ncbi:hypothetical protein [Flavobacterium wongokense]|uniref:hypothetical protein n=1 Tax=Flavobacterium wongokense TaxID=2910674 RepID=UPI001F3D73C8|nr:hypothetical protein [Flavobacterium sp. WG47]MCF6131677.1 hypothetical protein [Flavobacterium sp. WG47]
MSIKKFMMFGKLLTLVLLISSSVSAKSFIANGFQDEGTVTINNAGQSFHKNMLQPQLVHVNVTTEHTVKPISLGYTALLFNEKTSLTLKPSGPTSLILQDVDRCESVSKLLFPFHYFW